MEAEILNDPKPKFFKKIVFNDQGLPRRFAPRNDVGVVETERRKKGRHTSIKE